jgi:hypothetical protein
MGDTLGKGVDMDQMYEALIAFKKRGSEGNTKNPTPAKTL